MAAIPTRAQHEDHVRADGGYGSFHIEADDQSGKGTIWMEFCTTCSIRTGGGCNHEQCEWKPVPGTDEESMTALICKLCGADCT